MSYSIESDRTCCALDQLIQSIQDLEGEIETKNNQIEEWEAYEQEQIQVSKEFEELTSKCEKLEAENKELKDEIESRKSQTDTEIGELKEEAAIAEAGQEEESTLCCDLIEKVRVLEEALDEMNSFSMFKKLKKSEVENKQLKQLLADCNIIVK